MKKCMDKNKATVSFLENMKKLYQKMFSSIFIYY